MRSSKLTTLLTIAAASGIAMAMALPSSIAGAASSGRAAVAMPRAAGAMTRVIVMLRDDASGLSGRSAARSASVRSEESPLATLLRSRGARDVTVGRSLPYLVASVTSGQRKALVADPLVAAVEPDSAIPYPTPELPTGLLPAPSSAAGGERPLAPPSICGTAASPEVDPEAINVIDAPAAAALGYDGAGVTVAYIADGVNPADADFQRNTAYASAGSPAGSAVLTQENFTGDPTGTATAGGEAFLDSSSIAAQGNTVYNLDNYVNSSHPLTSPCDIKITGAAPGANVLGLDVFSTDHDTTESNFIQAIDYAVSQGVKVINESFGSNDFPDTALASRASPTTTPSPPASRSSSARATPASRTRSGLRRRTRSSSASEPPRRSVPTSRLPTEASTPRHRTPRTAAGSTTTSRDFHPAGLLKAAATPWISSLPAT